jgi:hypothetical protein
MLTKEDKATMKTPIAERVDQQLLAKCRAIDAETTDAALHELDRRQGGWLGIPEEYYVEEVEGIMHDFLNHKG